MPGHRIDRVSEDIKRELFALVKALKDPRVQDKMLTLARVEVSGDASFVKVYVSSIEGLGVAQTAVQGLTHATGLLRRELGQRLGLRKAPELKFFADDSIAYGMHIAQMLDKLSESGDPLAP